MTEKTGRPNDKKQDEWQQDLNPDPMAGQNHGMPGTYAAAPLITAFEMKELHEQLSEFSADELKQISILPTGTRLEQGATYIDLQDPQREEFTAMGSMEATENNCYVPKTEVGYQIWNRLKGVQNPERTGQV